MQHNITKKSSKHHTKSINTTNTKNTTNTTNTAIYTSHILTQFAHDIRTFHWNTQEYHAHKISGKLYKKINEHIDTIIEIIISIQQQKGVKNIQEYTSTHPSTTTTTTTTSTQAMLSSLHNFATQLQENTTPLAKILTNQPALSAVKDEMLKDIHKATYLMNMQ